MAFPSSLEQKRSGGLRFGSAWLQDAAQKQASRSESMSDTASSRGAGASSDRLARDSIVSIPRSGSSWVRVVQSIRRSLDQHLKPYFKVDAALASCQKRATARDKLAALAKSLASSGLLDFCSICLISPTCNTFGAVAIHGPGAELFPALLTSTLVPGAAASKHRGSTPTTPRGAANSPKSVWHGTGVGGLASGASSSSGDGPLSFFDRCVFEVEDSNWAVEDVATSRSPWYYDCSSGATTFGLPQEACWLKRVGMRSMLALPCTHAGSIVGVVTVASRNKTVDHLLLRKLEDMCAKLTPVMVEAGAELSQVLGNRRIVSPFEDVSDFAHAILGEMMNLDKAVSTSIQSQARQQRADAQTATLTLAGAAAAAQAAAACKPPGSLNAAAAPAPSSSGWSSCIVPPAAAKPASPQQQVAAPQVPAPAAAEAHSPTASGMLPQRPLAAAATTESELLLQLLMPWASDSTQQSRSSAALAAVAAAAGASGTPSSRASNSGQIAPLLLASHPQLLQLLQQQAQAHALHHQVQQQQQQQEASSVNTCSARSSMVSASSAALPAAPPAAISASGAFAGVRQRVSNQHCQYHHDEALAVANDEDEAYDEPQSATRSISCILFSCNDSLAASPMPSGPAAHHVPAAPSCTGGVQAAAAALDPAATQHSSCPPFLEPTDDRGRALLRQLAAQCALPQPPLAPSCAVEAAQGAPSHSRGQPAAAARAVDVSHQQQDGRCLGTPASARAPMMLHQRSYSIHRSRMPVFFGHGSGTPPRTSFDSHYSNSSGPGDAEFMMGSVHTQSTGEFMMVDNSKSPFVWGAAGGGLRPQASGSYGCVLHRAMPLEASIGNAAAAAPLQQQLRLYSGQQVAGSSMPRSGSSTGPAVHPVLLAAAAAAVREQQQLSAAALHHHAAGAATGATGRGSTAGSSSTGSSTAQPPTSMSLSTYAASSATNVTWTTTGNLHQLSDSTFATSRWSRDSAVAAAAMWGEDAAAAVSAATLYVSGGRAQAWASAHEPIAEESSPNCRTSSTLAVSSGPPSAPFHASAGDGMLPAAAAALQA